MSDNAGDFEIRDVPPGRYLVGVNLQDLPSKFNPAERFIRPTAVPGTSSRSAKGAPPTPAPGVCRRRSRS